MFANVEVCKKRIEPDRSVCDALPALRKEEWCKIHNKKYALLALAKVGQALLMAMAAIVLFAVAVFAKDQAQAANVPQLSLAGRSPGANSWSVPFTWSGDSMVTHAKINGKRVSLLIDTGSSGNISLYRACAHRLGLVNPIGKRRSKTIAGYEDDEVFVASNFRIGDEPVRNHVHVDVMNGGSSAFDGILPLAGIGTHHIAIDFRRRCCIATVGVASEEEVRAGASQALIIPFKNVDGLVFLSMKTADKTFTAEVDTGSPESLFNPENIKSFEVRSNPNFHPLFPMSYTNRPVWVPTKDDPVKFELGLHQGVYVFRFATNTGEFLVQENFGVFAPHTSWNLTRSEALSRFNTDALLGMTFLLQFDIVAFDFDRSCITLVGDRLGNLVEFPNGGVLLQPWVVDPIFVKPETIVNETTFLGSFQPVSTDCANYGYKSPQDNDLLAPKVSERDARVTVDASNLTICFPQGSFAMGHGDYILRYPIGVIAIWKDSGDTGSTPASGLAIPDYPRRSLSVGEALRLGNVFTPGLPGYKVIIEGDLDSGGPITIRREFETGPVK